MNNSDTQNLNLLPQAGVSRFNRNDIGRAGSRHKPESETAFNYAGAAPKIDDSHKQFIIQDADDCRNFRNDSDDENNAAKDNAQCSRVSLPDKNNSTIG